MSNLAHRRLHQRAVVMAVSNLLVVAIGLGGIALGDEGQWPPDRLDRLDWDPTGESYA